MRQGAGQGNPDPPPLESASPQRRRRVRWWRVVLFTLVPLLAAGVWGWLRPRDAWLGWSLVLSPIVSIALARNQRDVPGWARPRWIVAWAIGYGVLAWVAVLIGAWLAR
jgi:hypothetical protein